MLKVFPILLIGLSLGLLHQVTSQDAFAHSEVQVIEMTSNGFEPQEVTVDINQSVIFLNKDSVSRWPASNTHPTHELYPDFDPQSGVASGQSWAFKPTKAGVWKFHDHLFPHFRGVLTVVLEEGEQGLDESEASSEVSQKEESTSRHLSLRHQ